MGIFISMKFLFINELPTIFISLKIALLSTIINFPIAIFLGNKLSQKYFFGKIIIESILFFPLVIPPVATGYMLLLFFGSKSSFGYFLSTLGLEIPFTFCAAIIASITVSLPIFVRHVRVSISSIEKSLIEVAYNYGLSKTAVFKNITLPLSYNGILSGALFAFIRSLGEFGATMMFAGNINNETRTISIAIWHYLQVPQGEKKAIFLLFFSILIGLTVLIISEIFLLKKF